MISGKPTLIAHRGCPHDLRVPKIYKAWSEHKGIDTIQGPCSAVSAAANTAGEQS